MSLIVALGLDWPHICPVNGWVDDTWGACFDDNTPKYKTDRSTNEKYLNDTTSHTWGKFVVITCGATPYHFVSIIVAAIYRFCCCLFFYAFWKPTDEQNNCFSARAFEWLTDTCRLLLSPVGFLLLFLTAVYGLINPSMDARKLHAQAEIIAYGFPLLALCMHPQPFKDGCDNSMRRCQILITNSIVLSPLKMIARVIYHLVRFFSGYPVWKPCHAWEARNWRDRSVEWIKEGMNILITFFAVFALFGCALYSLYDLPKGEELYMNRELAFYGKILAEILNPLELREHFFRGDGDRRFSW